MQVSAMRGWVSARRSSTRALWPQRGHSTRNSWPKAKRVESSGGRRIGKRDRERDKGSNRSAAISGAGALDGPLDEAWRYSVEGEVDAEHEGQDDFAAAVF